MAAEPAALAAQVPFRANVVNYRVGPYRGVLPFPGGANIDVFCVDNLNGIGAAHQAYLTNLGVGANLARTRFGGYWFDNNTSAAFTSAGANRESALTRYRQAALLTELFKYTPYNPMNIPGSYQPIGQSVFGTSVSNPTWRDIHLAIWSRFDPAAVSALSASATNLINWARGQVIAKLAANDEVYFNRFTVISDAAMVRDANGRVNPLGGNGSQEFITNTVPEPAQLVLIGTGLLALGLIRTRKQG
ncbi:MAG: PEP-CTERM sorting domain-containing protein [Gemmatimonadales bacterium]|nr:PEP-CTERM sorting domain-containing protein [Gemmatimonadales bacterium]